MPITVLKQVRLPTMHLAFRLNARDTVILHDRLHQGIEKGRGMSFVIQQIEGSITLNWTREHAYEIQVSAWTTEFSRTLTAPLIGYQGQWDHYDLFFNAREGRKVIEGFFGQIKKLGPNPQGEIFPDYHQELLSR